MTLNFKPVQRLDGRIHLPASKSYSIRAHIIAARGGKSRILHPSDCDDALVSASIARQLSRLSFPSSFMSFPSSFMSFPRKRESSIIFSVGESGTTLRFLLPLLPFYTRTARVQGKGTLIGRPNAHLCHALREQGMDIRGSGPKESVPIIFKGGALRPGRIIVDASLSSQFISALLIALPSLPDDSRLILTGKKLVSQDYIQMTVKILNKAGIRVKRISAREYIIKGSQSFKGLKNFDVPSDYGLAAFPMSAAALLPSKVTLQGNLDDRWPQSDGHILGFLKRMGVKFTKTRRAITINGPFALKGGIFSLKDCPDLVPIMSVLALFAKGKTKLVDISHARAKESDRISDLRKELLKVGAKVSESRGAMTIEPRPAYKTGQLLDSHRDHRLAMAFTVLGLKIGCRVLGIESCRKSYPAFVRDIKTLSAS